MLRKTWKLRACWELEQSTDGNTWRMVLSLPGREGLSTKEWVTNGMLPTDYQLLDICSFLDAGVTEAMSTIGVQYSLLPRIEPFAGSSEDAP
jgi:hypothetical protein